MRKTRAGKSRDYRDVIVFEKLRVQNVFCPHENEKPTFSNSSGFKNVFEKLRFGDGLVWTVGLAVGQRSHDAGHFGIVFSNSSGLKNVFEKLRFGDELLWAVDLTVEIKLRFQISPASCGQGLGKKTQ